MSSSLIDDVVMVFSIPPIAVVLLVGLDISQVELVGYRGWLVLLSFALPVFFVLSFLVPGSGLRHLIALTGAIFLVWSRERLVRVDRGPADAEERAR